MSRHRAGLLLSKSRVMGQSFQGATGRLSSRPVIVTIRVASHAGAWLRQQTCSQLPSPLRAVAVYVSPERASPIKPNPCPGPSRKFSRSTATTAFKSVPGVPGGRVGAVVGCGVALG
jgi:hypothetical protein